MRSRLLRTIADRSAPLSLALALLTAGCAGNEPLAGQDVAHVDQAVSSYGVWGWGTPGNGGPDLDLGPADTQTCFMTGLSGSLKSSLDPAGSLQMEVRAGVYIVDGRWKIQTRAGFGPGVAVEAACIPFVHDRAYLTVTDHHPDNVFPYVKALPHRQCFLTAVSSFGYPGGWAGDFWNGPAGASIAKEGPNWVFRDFLIQNSTGQSSGSASAVCVDVPSVDDGIEYITTSAGYASKTFDNDPKNPWICGLTGLFGAFTSDWSHPGAGLYMDASTNWNVSMAADRRLYATCVQ